MRWMKTTTLTTPEGHSRQGWYKMPLNIQNSKKLKPTRRKLRNNATSAEKLLWLKLKQKQLKGRKFRRQHSIGPFVVDFFCYLEKN